jgi:predicted RNA-binding Zn-ribbon protein involved in translation (DUF1610 family)
MSVEHLIEVIHCPDCGAEIHDVDVERYIYKRFTLNYEKKLVIPENPSPGAWVLDDDYVFRCPECDSLNVGELLTGFRVQSDK